MRQIKFKGKAVMPIDELNDTSIEHDNGWVVGNLTQNGDSPWIIGDLIEVEDEYIVHEFWVKVHPETVGQYTGLYDIHGKEFCEGDVGYDNHYGRYGVVMYDEGSFIYSWEDVVEDLSEVIDDVEIIGNIHKHSTYLTEGGGGK